MTVVFIILAFLAGAGLMALFASHRTEDAVNTAAALGARRGLLLRRAW